MRRFLSLVLALTVVFTLFVSMSASADGYTFSFGEPSYSGNTATVPVLVDFGTSANEYLDAADFAFTTENCTITGATTTWTKDLDITVGTAISLGGSDNKYGVTGEALTSAGNVLFTINVTKTADNAKISFAKAVVEDTIGGKKEELSSTNAATIELWKSTPAVPEVKDVTTTATGTTFGNYKDVPLFDCAATIKNASKVFIAPELFLNEVSQGTKEKVEIPGLTADEAGANVVIKIAIVGADEGVVTINPNITAE